jgi:hypothetical protein
LSGFVGEEANEMEFIGWQTTGGEGGDQSAGSRHWFNPEAGVENGSNHAFAGITYSRATRVGDQSDTLPTAQMVQDLVSAAGFVETERAQQRFLNIEPTKQLAGVPGIFGGDSVAFPKHAQGTRGKVF